MADIEVTVTEDGLRYTFTGTGVLEVASEREAVSRGSRGTHTLEIELDTPYYQEIEHLIPARPGKLFWAKSLAGGSAYQWVTLAGGDVLQLGGIDFQLSREAFDEYYEVVEGEHG